MWDHSYRPIWVELVLGLLIELLAAIILLIAAKALASLPGFGELVTHPLTVLIVAILFLTLSIVFARRAIKIGRAVDVGNLAAHRQRRIWDTILGPTFLAFLSTFLLMLLFLLIFSDLGPDWRFYFFIGLLTINGVREFTKEYYLHREAFDKLMAQTLKTLHARCLQAVTSEGLPEGRVRLCVFLHNGGHDLVPHWHLGMTHDADRELLIKTSQGTVGRAFRKNGERVDNIPKDPVDQWAYTPEMQEMIPKDMAWEYSFPLLSGDPDAQPLGVLRIDSSVNLEVGEGNVSLGMIRSAALEYADQITLQLIIGPIRGQAGRRLI